MHSMSKHWHSPGLPIASPRAQPAIYRLSPAPQDRVCWARCIRRNKKSATEVALFEGDDDSGGERRPAAASRGCIRILDHELRTFQVILVVDFRADQVLVAHRIDQQLHAVLG